MPDDFINKAKNKLKIANITVFDRAFSRISLD